MSLFFIRLSLVLVVAVSAQSAPGKPAEFVVVGVLWNGVGYDFLFDASHPLRLRGTQVSPTILWCFYWKLSEATEMHALNGVILLESGPTIGNPHFFGL